MITSRFIAACLLTGSALSACTLPVNSGQGPALITGTVSYRERMMVPPDSVVRVSLEDISRMDVPSTVIADTHFRADGGPPYAFALSYDPARIDRRLRYSLRATIRAGDKLLFSSTEAIDPFREGDIDILVRRAGGS